MPNQWLIVGFRSGTQGPCIFTDLGVGMDAKTIASFFAIFAGGLVAGYLAFGANSPDAEKPIAAASVAAAGPIDEASVRRIVEAYIIENPAVIMRSVDDYQRGGSMLQIEAQAQPYLAALLKPEGAGILGDPDAEVKIIEFFDYQCPHCKANYGVLRRLLAEDPTVALMPKFLPILGDGSENDMSLYSARAAEAARLQGKFAAFHEALMASRIPLSREGISGVAESVGLDVPKMVQDITSEQVVRVVAEARAVADEIGISQMGTPGYIIGGKVMIGAAPDSYERLKAMIEAARTGD